MLKFFAGLALCYMAARMMVMMRDIDPKDEYFSVKVLLNFLLAGVVFSMALLLQGVEI